MQKLFLIQYKKNKPKSKSRNLEDKLQIVHYCPFRSTVSLARVNNLIHTLQSIWETQTRLVQSKPRTSCRTQRAVCQHQETNHSWAAACRSSTLEIFQRSKDVAMAFSSRGKPLGIWFAVIDPSGSLKCNIWLCYLAFLNLKKKRDGASMSLIVEISLFLNAPFFPPSQTSETCCPSFWLWFTKNGLLYTH